MGGTRSQMPGGGVAGPPSRPNQTSNPPGIAGTDANANANVVPPLSRRAMKTRVGPASTIPPVASPGTVQFSGPAAKGNMAEVMAAHRAVHGATVNNGAYTSSTAPAPIVAHGNSSSGKRKDVGANNRPLAGNKVRSLAFTPSTESTGGSMTMPNGSIDPDNMDAMSDSSDRDRDRGDGQAGKKRKVPSSVQTAGRDEAARDLDGELHEDDPFDGDVPDTFEPADQSREDDEVERPPSSRSRASVDPKVYIDNGDTDERDRDVGDASLSNKTGTSAFPRKFGRWTIREPVRSRAAQACGWKKALFLKRKAALITLFLDAQTAINQALTKVPGDTKADAKKDKSSVILPEVAVFEAMMPALEDVGVGQWPLDQPGWRTGVEVKDETKVYLEKWRTTYAKRSNELAARKKVVRGGWAPEGSFEFEVNSKASRTAQSRAKDHASLRKLIVELRAVTLNATKLASVQKTHAQLQDKTKAKAEPAKPAVSGQIETLVTTSGPTQTQTQTQADKDKENIPISSNNSSQGSEETATGKKKPKKKKRSVLANQSNPHHVDNYRPGRIPGTHGDPLEPYPWHDNLLFPPSMAFLSARPASKTRADDVQVDAAGVAPMTVRPSEDDYLCTFCEYALYYGTEAERRRAIRMRRRELKRKQTIKNRARNVAEGKGKGNLGREEEDEEEWDEEEGCEDGEGCQGRCSCGRPIDLPDKGREKKPPDRDDDHHHHHHHHHHDHGHDHHDHHHDHDHSHPHADQLD